MPLICDQIYKRWSFSINLKIKIKHAMYPLPCNLVSVFNVVVVAFKKHIYDNDSIIILYHMHTKKTTTPWINASSYIKKPQDSKSSNHILIYGLQFLFLTLRLFSLVFKGRLQNNVFTCEFLRGQSTRSTPALVRKISLWEMLK